MKRYNVDYNGNITKDLNGEYVRYEDVKITAIMNFNLLEQIRTLEAQKKELMRRDTQHLLNLQERDEKIKGLEKEIEDDWNYYNP